MKINKLAQYPDSIPLISLTDIMMTVLLFFILTSGASQEKIHDSFINIKHKTSTIFANKNLNSIDIEIDKTGNFFIDTKKTTKDQLNSILENKRNDYNHVTLKVDKMVPVVFVVEVMNISSKYGFSTSLEAEK